MSTGKITAQCCHGKSGEEALVLMGAGVVVILWKFPTTIQLCVVWYLFFTAAIAAFERGMASEASLVRQWQCEGEPVIALRCSDYADMYVSLGMRLRFMCPLATALAG